MDSPKQKDNVMQLSIDYTNRLENNRESNSILQANKDKINRQCSLVLELLKEGKRLTVRDALLYYNISSLPRRIKDLKDVHGLDIKDRLIDGRYKEYWLPSDNKESNCSGDAPFNNINTD